METIIGIVAVIVIGVALGGIRGTSRVIESEGVEDSAMSSVPLALVLVIVVGAFCVWVASTAG